MIAAKEVPFDRRMTLGKVISFTFAKFFKEISAVGQWLLLSLVVVLANIIPLGLIMFSVELDYEYMKTLGVPVNPLGDVNMPLLITGAVILAIALIFDIVVGIYTTAWFTRLGLDAFDGASRDFGERFKLGFKDLWRLGGPVVLLALFGLVVMIPYYIMDAMDGMAQGMSTPSMVAYAFGMIATFYMSIKMTAVYGILLENPEMQVMDCFKDSFGMTKGRGWRIFGYYISYIVVMILMMFVLVIPMIIIWVVAGVANMNIGIVGFAIILTIILYMLMVALSAGTGSIMRAGIYKYLMEEHTEEPAPSDSDETNDK